MRTTPNHLLQKIKNALISELISLSIISFIEEPKTIDRIIRHLELTFEAERPPPPRVSQQDLLMAAEESGEYF